MTPREAAQHITPRDRAAALDQARRLQLAADRMRREAEQLQASAARNDAAAAALLDQLAALDALDAQARTEAPR